MLIQRKDLVSIGIDLGQFPEFLYRYRPINEFTLDELQNGYIWFSNFEEYNDPFEGILHLETDCTEDELMQYLSGVQIEGKNISTLEIEKMRKSYFSDKKAFNQNFNEKYKTIKSRVGICSFTTKPDNLLMWSHYSKGHTGICIKYKLEKLITNDLSPLKVDYTSTYPKYNFIVERNDPIKLATESFIKKSEDWEYEDEHRIIHLNRQGKFGISHDSMVEIIIGSRCKQDSINKITDAISKNYLHNPKVTYAKLEDEKYGININK